jgi:hypothetical protein
VGRTIISRSPSLNGGVPVPPALSSHMKMLPSGATTILSGFSRIFGSVETKMSFSLSLIGSYSRS